jgi:hypothetical protein
MIAKECLPTLRRGLSSFDHIFGHAGLTNLDAELEKLAVDARRVPECIGDAHLLAWLRVLLRLFLIAFARLLVSRSALNPAY